MVASVEVKNLDVVFGRHQAETLSLMDKGMSRDQIRDHNGDVVGVQNANISVQSGEICVLMGLSGSGKSSLLRTVNGLNKVARGNLWVQDGERRVDVANCDEATLRHLRTKRVSMVFQKFALMPWLTVAENVAFGLEMQGVSRKIWQKQVQEKLELVGLYEWRNLKPDELSGGMQQRVGLARAFAMDTDILLMDEPFSALDPLIRTQLQDELIQLQQRLHKTILFVSHDLDEALKIGSNIAIMESARIIQYGSPEQIVLNPANAYVENFVAHTNPLHVLTGKSLMQPLQSLAFEHGVYRLDGRHGLSADSHGAVTGLQVQGQVHHFTLWQPGKDLSQVEAGMAILAPLDIPMRDAMELRYRTGLPVCLSDQGRCVGVLNDEDFYEALLGKHFQASQAAEHAA
ncbi:choline ABC transporter ATP-binding protein [Balneatrix alpica]|uniref:Choline ABC transporter ATP-binding protein n=1 Tax=Balneatrix alpica TaxID=75684 RepID=A0ABV5ZAP5_9GAMM|nr:choline ABC transporter ATP-binding protein [Balneatrix alpica]